MSAKPRSKPESQSARSRIINAAKERFAIAGFEGTSTRQIADHAGVAQSLLLYHFESKDALWRAVMDHMFASVGDLSIASLQNEETSVKDRLSASIDAFIQICARDPDLHRLMTLEGRCESDRLSWMVDTHLRRFFEPTRDLIRKGQKQGTVRPGDPTMLYYTIIAIAGSMFSFEPEMTLLDAGNQAQSKTAVSELIKSVMFTTD